MKSTLFSAAAAAEFAAATGGVEASEEDVCEPSTKACVELPMGECRRVSVESDEYDKTVVGAKE